MNLDQFLALPRCGVFLVVNEVTRCFYINYSTSMGQSLARLYDDWGGKPRAGTLEFRVLSNISDIETLRLYTRYWRDRYLALGYSELGPRGRDSLVYRCRVVVDPDFTKVGVELVNSRGDVGRVVGKFKTAADAQEFSLYAYGKDNPYCLPVYAINSLTKEFVLTRETRGIELR